MVKLLYNRSNNKYSYTRYSPLLSINGVGIHKCTWPFTSVLSLHFSNSDDNLLKNIELFDKLSLRFNGRVLFIKDVIGDEICCWSFYGQGRKLAEVCCTSIVYATEKKQTKVLRLFGFWWSDVPSCTVHFLQAMFSDCVGGERSD